MHMPPLLAWPLIVCHAALQSLFPWNLRAGHAAMQCLHAVCQGGEAAYRTNAYVLLAPCTHHSFMYINQLPSSDMHDGAFMLLTPVFVCAAAEGRVKQLSQAIKQLYTHHVHQDDP